MQIYSFSSDMTMIDSVVMHEYTKIKKKESTATFEPSVAVWQQIDPEHSVQW